MRIPRPNRSLGASAMPSDWGQAFATVAAAIAQDCAATLAVLARQKPMLPDPAPFGRLILSFHKSIQSRDFQRKIHPHGEFGKLPKIGTPEHISELLSVKDAKGHSSTGLDSGVWQISQRDTESPQPQEDRKHSRIGSTPAVQLLSLCAIQKDMKKSPALKRTAMLHALRLWLFRGLFSVIFAGFAVITMAQPTNDNFANRIALTGNVNVPGTLSNATSEVGEPLLPGISSGQTVWWTWTAPANGILSLSDYWTPPFPGPTVLFPGSGPLVTVYTGSDLPDLSLVASNNYLMCYQDGECGCHWRQRGQIVFHVTQGQTYQICVDAPIVTDASLQLVTNYSLGTFVTLGSTATNNAISVMMMGISWGPVFTTNLAPEINFQLGLGFTPAPTNDDFANATPLTGKRTRIAASNSGATKQPGEPDHLGNLGGSSVWYSWIAPASGRVSLSTNNIPPYLPPTSSGGDSSDTTLTGGPNCGNQIDVNPPPPFFPLLTAYTGTAVDALTPANCLPMGLSAFPHAVEFDAVKGQSYMIAYDGNMGTTGDITLFLALTKPASNDHFKSRIPLHGVNVAVTGFNAGATSEPGEPALPDSAGKSVWWSWTAPVSGTASIDLGGSDYPFPVGVFTGTSLAKLSGVATNSGSVSFSAVQGRTYQIAVDDAAGLTGEIKFTLQIPPVVLPLIGTRQSGNLTVLEYSASPGQVVLLQSSSDGSNWTNVGTVTARQHQVNFAVKGSTSGKSYRALVVD
jgi:hypothetical protein